jgi:hypothetical protein
MEETIFGLSNNDYHNTEPYSQWLSSSQLKNYMVSPKVAKYRFDHPEESAINPESAEFGSLFHAAMESLVNTGELDDFRNSVFIFNPPVNIKTGLPYGKTTKTYQTEYALALESQPGKIATDEKTLNTVMDMVGELIENCGETSKQVRKFIKWGKAEVSHFTEYEDCKFKFRPDVETKNKIIDWKTLAVDDLHEDTIAKIIIRYGYDISAAFYQFFMHQITGQWYDFYWVMITKSLPYDAVVVDASNWAFSKGYDGTVDMGVGAHKFMKLLEQHIYCTKNNIFAGAESMIMPGYQGRRIMTANVPGYEMNKLFEYFNEKELI